MIDIGATDFSFAVPHLSERELQRYSLQLFDLWESSVESTLLLPDYALLLEVEEGSIKGQGRIAVALAALYFGIGNYGSFISGLQIIRAQVATVSDYLAEQAGDQLGRGAGPAKVRKRSGTLGSLQRLFVKVQSGEITPEQATEEAKLLIGDDASDSPQFMVSLEQALHQAPKFHEQVPLHLEGAEEAPRDTSPEKERHRRPSIPYWPLPAQLRVEVWRESKKQKKNFRITNV